jgi:tetratricopeptide (TPR) repeat protein
MFRAALLSLLLAAGAALAQTSPPATTAPAPPDQKQAQTVQEAIRLLRDRRPQQAILAADEVIDFYETRQRITPQRVFCARNGKEALHYIEQHARQNTGRDAIVVRNWCDALFLKGYALVEIGDLAGARAALRAAIALSPANAQYHAELAAIHTADKNWNDALESFRAAEAAAEFSEGARQAQLARIHRGTGHVLVELKRYDEAEQRYRQSLELEPDNEQAKQQLEAIRELRAKPGAGPS